jgi:hypothetical protein
MLLETVPVGDALSVALKDGLVLDDLVIVAVAQSLPERDMEGQFEGEPEWVTVMLDVVEMEMEDDLEYVEEEVDDTEGQCETVPLPVNEVVTVELVE